MNVTQNMSDSPSNSTAFQRTLCTHTGDKKNPRSHNRFSRIKIDAYENVYMVTKVV